ncbi:MAG: DsbA family protein [Parvibaculaceae bacterium]|nr:DsbA family protein [Parvibaculaceae bacterium]
MKFPRFPALALAALMGLHAPVANAASESSAFSDSQKQEIGTIVRSYLLDHPEVLVEVMQELDKRQKAENESKASDAIAKNASQLYKSPADFVGGNVKGDVTIVEFFDYQCGYCRAAAEPLQQATSDDGHVRVIFKEFPILGPASVTASRAAIASIRQNKYMPFHMALLHRKGPLTDDIIFTVARDNGIDVAKLKKDMEDPSVMDTIKGNYELARTLQVDGTPAFIIGNELVPGAIGADEMRKHIDAARASQKS